MLSRVDPGKEEVRGRQKELRNEAKGLGIEGTHGLRVVESWYWSHSLRLLCMYFLCTWTSLIHRLGNEWTLGGSLLS